MITRLKTASQSLTFRIAALLAITLLPIGLISLIQTHQLLDAADRRAENSLVALTADAAAGEEAYIRTAFGAAQAIAGSIPTYRESGWDCQEPLSNFLRLSNAFSFAGYVSAEGVVTCASGGQGMDVSTLKLVGEMRDDPQERVSVVMEAPISMTSVIVVAVPVFVNGIYDGYVGVSLPHRSMFNALQEEDPERPVELLTFNAAGEVLTSDAGWDNVEGFLPAGRDLVDLTNQGEQSFIGRNNNGDVRVFAVVPIVDGTVYALGSWDHARRAAIVEGLNITGSILFPIAMWLACVGVAFFAVQRMVIRPTRNLRARMLYFMRSRKISPPKYESATPLELREMEDTWARLAENVLHDEAELHDMIHEKTVLLREVHHRVKNNLQLIASILNMKMRKSKSTEVRQALSNVQLRVMNIARVHQKLYETSTEERVRADELLKTIVGQTIGSFMQDVEGVSVEQTYDPIVVYPDQAVPLTLATSELVTNAMKYVGRPQQGKPWLLVKLEKVDDLNGCITISNSTGDVVSPDAALATTNLGHQLINAFVMQMNGSIEENKDDDQFSVTIRFPIAEFDETEPTNNWDA